MEDHADSSREEQLLLEAYQTRAETPEQIFALVYDELKMVARAYMRRERPDHTLQATALVNEVYLRLFDGQPFEWENRKHLFCTVTRAMRRVLVDPARKRNAERRGGDQEKVTLDERIRGISMDPDQLLAVDEVLERLKDLNPRQAQVVDLHSFAGLTEEETAGVLGVSLKTVKNDWRFAKAWLKAELARTGGTP
jgi:RNA polymerase sigma-70 factor (ECF subfamily)